MKNIKQITTIALAAMMSLTLMACGKTAGTSSALSAKATSSSSPSSKASSSDKSSSAAEVIRSNSISAQNSLSAQASLSAEAVAKAEAEAKASAEAAAKAAEEETQRKAAEEAASGVTGKFTTAASIITSLDVPAGYDGEFYIAWEAGFKDHPPAGEVRARIDSNTAYYFAAPGIDGYAQVESVEANRFFNNLKSSVERLQQGGSGESGVDIYIENGVATSMYIITS